MIGYISYLGFAVVSPVMQDVVFSQHSLDHLSQTNLPNELSMFTLLSKSTFHGIIYEHFPKEGTFHAGICRGIFKPRVYDYVIAYTHILALAYMGP